MHRLLVILATQKGSAPARSPWWFTGTRLMQIGLPLYRWSRAKSRASWVERGCTNLLESEASAYKSADRYRRALRVDNLER